MEKLLEFARRNPAPSQLEKKPVTGEPDTREGTIIHIEELGKRRHRINPDAVIDGLVEKLSKRQRRNELYEKLEDEWWQAHESGDKDVQRGVEEEIGSRLGVRKGGNFIYRLRTTADIYESMSENPEGLITPLPFKPRPKE